MQISTTAPGKYFEVSANSHNFTLRNKTETNKQKKKQQQSPTKNTPFYLI